MSERRWPQLFINISNSLRELGLATALLVESFYWIVFGRSRGQPVRLQAVVNEAMEIGVRALPIVTMLSAAIGLMLALQGIDSLRTFGAESRVSLGLGLSVTREFASLITGILVAGRSGSALAAKLGTMQYNQEVDALRVMGINPVRYLVAPPLLAMLIMMPVLTWWADMMALLAAGLYVSFDLGLSLLAYVDQLRDALKVSDIMHGISKGLLFGFLTTLVGVVNGINVTGGAEGVGRVTTRSVVHAISAIVIADVIFTYFVVNA